MNVESLLLRGLFGASVLACGLALAIDIGEPKDIHPKNKQEVGRRLALVAEKQVYGKDLVASGPTLPARSVTT